jgi:AcrR family transcriptional regulator
MLRTRTAILDATALCIERYGVRKTTMSDVSSRAGVAKATLYNHFRTKDDLLAALVLARIEALAAAAAEQPSLAAALERVAAELAGSAPLRRVAGDEPAVLAALVTPTDGRGWAAARAAVQSALSRAGAAADPPAVDLVLRWLAGHALWAATPAEASLGAQVLAAGLQARPPAHAPAADVPAADVPAADIPAGGAPAGAVPAAPTVEPTDGLGWPG